MSKLVAPSNPCAALSSAQGQVHARLQEVVARHLLASWRAPLRASSAAAFEQFAAWHARSPALPWWLDSGCGTGASTLALARRHPDRRIVGIDQSAARLAVGLRALDAPGAPTNALLVRCHAPDFWRLAVANGLSPEQHFLFYPNPWPKAAHLRRRWHGHPAFPMLLALGGALEMRCNWDVYAREFALALRCAGRSARAERFAPDEPISPFERKYAACGHALWLVRGQTTEDGGQKL